MARMMSTAVSDMVLALSVFWLVKYLLVKNMFAALGFMIQGFAATAGVARFSSQAPGTTLTNVHKYLSWFARIAGMPLVAVGFCKYVMPYLMNLNFMFSLGVIFTNKLLDESQRSLVNEACSGFAMLTIIAVSYTTWNVAGLAASFVYVVSGLVIGSEGSWGGMQRVDILHYALVVGNVFFYSAL
ncbi:uncharacterized protein [Haliotis asinina]|uniref:uncharacterized protein n=1 Tax=Haliotis asinina TaxID=109174 RepID=UPI00353204FB